MEMIIDLLNTICEIAFIAYALITMVRINAYISGGANYNPTINITREDYEAFKVAIGIMRKYQEIQEIATEWQQQNDPKIKFVASNSNMTKIAEVLDGNDEKTKSSDEP